MVNEIGRLASFGLGIETTSGTAVSATNWIPTDDFSLKPMVEKSKDDNAFGVIDELSGSAIQKESSELTAGGIARSNTIGYLLKLALGTAGSATLVETGVYSHAFTRLNSNSHPSATVYMNKGNTDERAPYAMVDSLELSATLGEFVKFSASMKGGKIEDTTSSPSFLTGTADEAFRASKVTVKLASDISGLGAASAITLQNIKFSIAKNLNPVFKLGSTALDAQVNQQFWVTGDFEAIYDGNTYRDLFTANTKKALQIEIEGATLIGSTKYNKITIQLAQVMLESWDRSSGNNDLVSETIGFVGEYSFGDTQTINVSLQNTKSANY